jgi:energy-coupling factor transporter ATP-binding protein EcfA2
MLLSVRGLRRLHLAASFDLGAGECVVLHGPSGSGKTQLLRALADLDPNEGAVQPDGTPREAIPELHLSTQEGRKVRCGPRPCTEGEMPTHPSLEEQTLAALCGDALPGIPLADAHLMAAGEWAPRRPRH